jgi:hypothetical protein
MVGQGAGPSPADNQFPRPDFRDSAEITENSAKIGHDALAHATDRFESCKIHETNINHD